MSHGNNRSSRDYRQPGGYLRTAVVSLRDHDNSLISPNGSGITVVLEGVDSVPDRAESFKVAAGERVRMLAGKF